MATLIQGEMRDLGGFEVKRILPNRVKKMVGPFVFLDHMGPAHFPAGEGANVRPHPHIGLATLSYLYSGSILHRDSLGNVQEIHPGEVNLMTAGRGIVHSERETFETRAQNHELNGLQFWLALPPEKAEIDPSFQHIKREQLPHRYQGSLFMRLIAGEAYGMTSPARTHSPMFFLDVIAQENDRIELPHPTHETAIYLQTGELSVDGQTFCAGDFILLEPHETVTAKSYCRFALLGGEKFEQVPFLRWNFVAYSRERLKQAEEDWQAGRFPVVPGDDSEFIPLPSLSSN